MNLRKPRLCGAIVKKQTMKYPPPDITNKITLAHHTNARHTAGRFAFIYFPDAIRFWLTKVNNYAICDYKPISCEHVVFAIPMPENSKVNKMGYSFETKQSFSYSIDKINLLD
jgi:hypothetical protein